MYLIIAEKRSAAEKVGSCIKGESFKKGDGFIQSQNYYITWCAGHLYTLLDLEEYDPNYDPNEKHKWTMDGLPFSSLSIQSVPAKGKCIDVCHGKKTNQGH